MFSNPIDANLCSVHLSLWLHDVLPIDGPMHYGQMDGVDWKPGN